jgi:hypothetical protein
MVALLLALHGTSGAAASSEVFQSGKDWSDSLSPNEKMMALVPPAILFRSYHVPLARNLPEYIPLIDRVLLYNPELGKEDIANIFASTLYHYEPQTRPALEFMETEFLRGNYHTRPANLPRVRFYDPLRETPGEA